MFDIAIISSQKRGRKNSLNTQKACRRSSGALPHTLFLEHVKREKCRAVRSHAPLSIVLLSLNAAPGYTPQDLLALSTLIDSHLRATDFLGWHSKDTLAALLVDTEESGARQFLNKILDTAGDAPIRYSIHTYPHHAFELLLDGGDSDSTHEFIDHLDDGHLPSYAAPLKRVIDVFGSLIALVALAPILIATAISVKASTEGPIIFRQIRVGRGGRSFILYKFRSMRVDVDDEVHRAYVKKLIKDRCDVNQGDASKPLFKLRGDPRITGVGRFIRKTSIDELPQLYNVLRGDMSLVGPRPPLPYEVAHYSAWHLRRILEAQPGITGLWQVNGRSETSFDEMVRLDLQYLRQWSLGLDIKILIKTVIVVLTCQGSA